MKGSTAMQLLDLPISRKNENSQKWYFCQLHKKISRDKSFGTEAFFHMPIGILTIPSKSVTIDFGSCGGSAWNHPAC